MKPRLRRVMHFWDCGWPYEVWHCQMPGDAFPRARGVGESPKAAYADWLGQVQVKGASNGKAG